jgi:sugar phosphate isomerase/epimerase
MIRGSKEEQLTVLRKKSLDICFIHAHSEIPSNELWLQTDMGDMLTKEFMQAIEDCNRINVPTMVMHITSGSTSPPQSEIGLQRLYSLTKYAENLSINIAIENIRFPAFVTYALENISENNLGFCYDSGHDFLYSPEPYQILHKHGNRLKAVHLHDNEGTLRTRYPDRHPDSHAIPGEGNIDWNRIKTILDAENYTGVRLLEIESNTMQPGETPQLFLERAYNALMQIL